MTYKEYINSLKKAYIGEKIKYDGDIYTVVGVDYNGFLLINKFNEYGEATAINTFEPI